MTCDEKHLCDDCAATLDELAAENRAAYAADIHTGNYERRVAASCAKYIPALEAEVKRLRGSEGD